MLHFGDHGKGCSHGGGGQHLATYFSIIFMKFLIFYSIPVFCKKCIKNTYILFCRMDNTTTTNNFSIISENGCFSKTTI